MPFYIFGRTNIRLVSDLHEKLNPTAFSITYDNFDEFEEKKPKVIKLEKGRLSALSPTGIFIVMLIKI